MFELSLLCGCRIFVACCSRLYSVDMYRNCMCCCWDDSTSAAEFEKGVGRHTVSDPFSVFSYLRAAQ